MTEFAFEGVGTIFPVLLLVLDLFSSIQVANIRDLEERSCLSTFTRSYQVSTSSKDESLSI